MPDVVGVPRPQVHVVPIYQQKRDHHVRSGHNRARSQQERYHRLLQAGIAGRRCGERVPYLRGSHVLSTTLSLKTEWKAYGNSSPASRPPIRTRMPRSSAFSRTATTSSFTATGTDLRIILAAKRSRKSSAWKTVSWWSIGT